MDLNVAFEFIQHHEIIGSPLNYENIRNKIYHDFSHSWPLKALTLLLIGYRDDIPAFIDWGKEILQNHPLNPDSKEEYHQILLSLNNHKVDPKIVKCFAPKSVAMVKFLNKHKLFSFLIEEYVELFLKDKVRLTEELNINGIFPQKVKACAYFHTEESFDLKLGNTSLDNLFHTFKLNNLEYILDFIPTLCMYNEEEKEQLSQYTNSETKDYLYPPIAKNIRGLILPVNLSFQDGRIYICSEVINNQKIASSIQIDISQPIESMLTLSLDPLLLFKILNEKENFTDAEQISKIIFTSKNKPLSKIIIDYYNNKYKENPRISIDGAAIYSSFLTSKESCIVANELIKFNLLIQEHSLNEDKAKFIIFYERMYQDIPPIIKQIIDLKKWGKKIIDPVLNKMNQKVNKILD